MLEAPTAWSAVGLAEGAPYFATVAAFGDAPWDAWLEDTAAAVAGCPGVRVAGGALARRGAVIRCLAESAVAPRRRPGRAWGAARHRLLACPPLALRKL